MNDPVHILVAKTDEADFFFLKEQLGKMQLKIGKLLLVNNTDEAITQLQSKTFDIILLDLDFGNSAGLGIFHTIYNQTLKYIPIVVFSHPTSNDLLYQVVNEGAQDYLIKGEFDHKLLEKTIRCAINRAQNLHRLQILEQCSNNLFENNPISMWAFDPMSLKIVMVNNAAVELYGYTHQEFLSMTIKDLRPAEEVSKLLDLLSTVSRERKTSGPWKHKKKDGNIVNVQVTAHTIHINNQTLRLVAAHEINEQIETIELLKNSEERLRLAISAGRMVTLDIDYLTDQLKFSEHAKEFLGISQLSLSLKETMALIPPDDHQSVINALSTGKLEGKLKDLQFRLIRPDNGKVIWVERRSSIKYGPHEKPIGSRGILVDITTLKEAEEKIALSEQRFKALVQEGSDLIGLLDQEGNYLYISPSSNRILGFSPGYFYNKNAFALIHPDDVIGVKEQFTNIFTKKYVHIKSFRLKSFSGNWRWLEAIATNLLDDPAVKAIVVNSRDITERQKTESHLRLLESAITHANDAILITEVGSLDLPGSRIVYANRAFTEMTGYTLQEVIGKTPRLLQGPKTDIAELAKLTESLKNWEPTEVEIVNYTKNGEEFWVNLSVVPIRNEKGEYTHWISIQRNTTERRKSEEMTRRILETQVEERTRELKLSLEKEKGIAHLKNKFISMVSHEFRTPLASINFAAGYLKKFRDKLDAEAVDEKLKQILQQVNHMTSTMEDVLTIGKSEAKIQTIMAPLSIRGFISNIVHEISEITNSTHAIKLNIEIDNDIFTTDEKLIRTIVINLLSNAIKFSPGKNEVIFLVHETDVAYHFEVTDFGIGVPHDELEKIFEPFHRSQLVGTIQGAGLGLSIVKRAVDILEGSVHVVSKQDKCTTFTVILPKK